MKISINDGLLTFSDLEVPKDKLADLEAKVNKSIDDSDVNTWIFHSDNDFSLCIKMMLYLSDDAIIEDIFKGREDLLQRLWKVFCRENGFNGNKNDCQVSVYSYHGDVKKFIIPVQSVINEITNSSSELFIVKSDNTAEQILELLENVKNPDELCSGDGGVLECKELSVIENMLFYIYNIDDYYEDYEYKVFDDFYQEEIDFLNNIIKQHFNTTQNLYEVRIDNGFKTIIDFVEKQLGGIRDD